MLLGGFAAQHNRVPIDSDLCKLLFVAASLILLSRRVRWFAFPLFGFALFMQAGNGIIDARLDARFAGDSMLSVVRILDFPKMSGKTASFLIEPVDDNRLPGRSRVSWFDAPEIPELGEVWELELRLRRPGGNMNPGGFNSDNWMFREKIAASGYVVAGQRNRRVAAGDLSIVDDFKVSYINHVRLHEEKAAPIIAAIGVGTRHLISSEQWARFSLTGTSHLLAISGLHIGLAAAAAFAVLFVVLGICRVPGNFLVSATVGAAGFAAAYAAISGFAVPSQRATVMLVLAALAFFSRRQLVPGRIVAQVAVLVFVVDPVAIMKPGFSLSFGAVTLLLYFGRCLPPSRNGPRFLAKSWFAVRQLFSIQIVLLFGLMPLTVLIFERIALTAPLANMVVVPIFSLLTVPMTLLSLVMHPVSVAASSVILKLCAASVDIIESYINRLASLGIADISVAGVDQYGGTIALAVVLPIVWVVLPKGWPGRWVAVLAVVALISYRPSGSPQQCFDTLDLDVGQGLSVVVQTKHQLLMFDSGPSYRSGGSAVERLVLPFLRYRGIKTIDWLVVSHSDNDHAGGVPALLDNMKISAIYAGEALPVQHQAVRDCRAGHGWQADGVDFQFIYPPVDSLATGNDASCVLAIGVGDYSLLLTGDIEARAEEQVLASPDLSSAAVVLIPHHGSLTSSSPLLVNRLRPRLAIASAGYSNRWGFPKDRVRKRWEGSGAIVLDTASSGAISFRLCAGTGLHQLRTEREWQRRFWHDTRAQ